MRSNGKRRRPRRKRRLGSELRPQPEWAAAFGAAFRAQRRAFGLTQAELAALAGIGLAFLYELERGKSTVRLDKLLDVARVLGIELRLMSGKQGLSVDPSLLAEPAP